MCDVIYGYYCFSVRIHLFQISFSKIKVVSLIQGIRLTLQFNVRLSHNKQLDLYDVLYVNKVRNFFEQKKESIISYLVFVNVD